MARCLSLLLLVPVLLFAAGCRKALVTQTDTNKQPTTWIQYGPVDSTEASYRVHIYWGGTDPDGYIAGFLVAVTDSTNFPAPPPTGGLDSLRLDPRFTTRTDSLFVFTANDPLVLSHRVYVAAIDNEGRLDNRAIETGHFIYFNARNRFAPQVFIQRERITIAGETFDSNAPRMYHGHLVPTVGVPDTVQFGGSMEYDWIGTDRDPGSRVTNFAYQLSVPMTPISGDASLTRAKLPDITIPLELCTVCQAPLADGTYEFRVTAIDEAGAESESGTGSGSGEAFVVGYDPVTFAFYDDNIDAPIGPSNLNKGALLTKDTTFVRVVDFSGRVTFTPTAGVYRGIPQSIPYAMTSNGRPDTLSENSVLRLRFVAADSAGGDRGLVSGYSFTSGFAGTLPIPLSIHESYSEFYPEFTNRIGTVSGAPVQFRTPIAFPTPVEMPRFTVDVPFAGSNFTGTNYLRVRARDRAGRNDGYHTNYPNLAFEVGFPPRYAINSTYVQAGSATGPNTANPQYFATWSGDVGDFGQVILPTADSVLWIVYGSAIDQVDPPTPLPGDWVKKRAVIQKSPSVGVGSGSTTPTAWTNGPQASFFGLEDGVSYRIDIAVRDHANSDTENGRNWSLTSAGKELRLTICRTCSPSASIPERRESPRGK